MNLDESLSRLVSDDLSEADAAQLRQRIASEPEVAAAYEEMQSMIGMLYALPAAHTPPALVLPAPAAIPAGVGWRVAPWLLAAAAIAFAFLRPIAQPELILASGTTLVDGEFSLFAGDVEIALDGRAAVFVEPRGGVMRVDQQTPLEDPMNSKSVVAGLGGAVITVTVYEGSALVMADETQPPNQVGPGEVTSFRTGGPVPSAQPDTPERAAELTTRAAVLEAELEATRKELATEKFAGALTRGQLAAREGVPSAWPEDVPEAVSKDNFKAGLTETVKDLEDFEIAHINCEEYPCIASLRYSGTDDSMEWGTPLNDAVSAWTDGTYEEGRELSVSQSRFKSDDSDDRFVLFGVHGSEDPNAVSDRMKVRMDDMLSEIADELKETAEE